MSLPDIAQRPRGLQQVPAYPAVGAGVGYRRVSGGGAVAPSGDWDSCNPAFALSRGSPGTSSHTPGHDHRFPGMLFSLTSFRVSVSHWIQRYLLSSLPAKRAI